MFIDCFSKCLSVYGRGRIAIPGSSFLSVCFCFFGFEMDTDESGWAPGWRAGVGVFAQWIRDRITARGMEVGLKPCVW